MIDVDKRIERDIFDLKYRLAPRILEQRGNLDAVEDRSNDSDALIRRFVDT